MNFCRIIGKLFGGLLCGCQRYVVDVEFIAVQQLLLICKVLEIVETYVWGYVSMIYK